MSITYDSSNKIFYLNAGDTSYIIGITDGLPVNIHWGKRINKIISPETYEVCADRAFYCYDPKTGTKPEGMLHEYPVYGHGDFRNPAFQAIYTDGSTVTELRYKEHRIYNGKLKPDGLPATYASDNEAQTLEITLTDEKTGLDIVLNYTAFEKLNVITRHVVAVNNGKNEINIKSIMSSSIDFRSGDFDIISLHGAWARERHVQRTKIPYGTTTIDSKRGASSHCLNPFIALADKNATEDYGDVFAMNFVYSGNFVAGAELDPHDRTRMFMGINPFDFNWKLCPGETFTAPEVVMVYSANGIGEMSRTYHDLYRNHLCKSTWAKKERPILINNWEATYFDFNEEKIIDIAKKAKEIGVELMVLDDGWFGNRNDDTTSLGDWFVNPDKLPDGIEGLSRKIEELGMKFGIWFEPEMISPVSHLNEIHPEWCLCVDGRKKFYGRNQMILDYSNPEVCEYIINVLSDIIDNSCISYIKWDMNRYMTEVGSGYLSSDRQRETAHRYILGLYRVMETLTEKYPHILFEGCAGGGGRFDPGILHYMPQIWTSDDSDAVERLFIQYGTSYAYPAITMGAHVSAVPNHQVRRTTSVKMRGDVALMGQFGFELDLNILTKEELEDAKKSIQKYKELRNTVHNGMMYRLASPFDGNYAIWQFISEDEKQVVIVSCNILSKPNCRLTYIKAKNLSPDAVYEDKEKNIIISGSELMNVGIPVTSNSDFNSDIFVFTRR